MLKLFEFFCEKAQNIIPVFLTLESAIDAHHKLGQWIDAHAKAASAAISEGRMVADDVAAAASVIPAAAPIAAAADTALD